MNHQISNDQRPQDTEKKIQYEKFMATKPRKPLHAYFKFRQQKMIELKDDENRNIKMKEAWDQLSENTKEEMSKQHTIELQEYRQQIQVWMKQSEKFGSAVHRQRPNRKIQTISINNNYENNQQAGCWSCNQLLRQKATLQQQIIRLQENLSNMQQKIATQSNQTQKYKSSYEELLQILKKKQNP